MELRERRLNRISVQGSTNTRDQETVGLMLLAETDMDPATLIPSLLNFGGLGILSAVLLYLLIYLNKQRETDRVEFKGEAVAERTATSARLGTLLTTFKEEQKYEREQCSRHFDVLASAIDKNQDVLTTATNVLGQQQKLLEEHHRLAQAISADLHTRTKL